MEVNTTDLIRRRWLNNDFYGTVFFTNYQDETVDVIIGGGFVVFYPQAGTNLLVEERL